MVPPPPDTERCAFFFDLDGTLAEIAPRPHDVHLARQARPALDALSARCAGALALVSGRPLHELDALLGAPVLPGAGVHGAERRDAAGQVHRLPAPALAPAQQRLQALVAARPQLTLEVKPGALAMHYRGADGLAGLVREAMSQALALVPGAVLLEGKKVIELKSAQADKGRALRAFMAEPPFTGRQPWMFGDDVTDETAFAAAQDTGGAGVKIGPGESAARWRLASPAALLEWLQQVAR